MSLDDPNPHSHCMTVAMQGALRDNCPAELSRPPDCETVRDNKAIMMLFSKKQLTS